MVVDIGIGIRKLDDLRLVWDIGRTVHGVATQPQPDRPVRAARVQGVQVVQHGLRNGIGVVAKVVVYERQFQRDAKEVGIHSGDIVAWGRDRRRNLYSSERR